MRLPHRAPSHRPGMSLLEVLVALAIFIMSLAALGQLVQLGLEQAADADRQTVATRLAQSKMAEVEAGAIGMEGGSGKFDDQETASNGTVMWEWTAECVLTESENVYDVTVTVTATTGSKFSLSLHQLVFDPAFLGTAAPATDPTAVPADPAAPAGNLP